MVTIDLSRFFKPETEMFAPGMLGNIKHLHKKACDVLLIVSIKQIRKKARQDSFSKNDFSFAWINTMLQEVGTVAWCDLDGLDNKTINNYKVLILSRSASEIISDRKLLQLKRAIANDKVLLIEFSNSNKYIASSKITYIDPKFLDKKFSAKLEYFDMKTDLLHPVSAANVILKMDGKPAIFYEKKGGGTILYLCFDFGKLVTKLQQGAPTVNYRTPRRHSMSSQCTVNLVEDKKLLTSFFPCADVLEKFIVGVIEDFTFLPRAWYFPQRFTSAVIFSHDEDYFGNKSAPILEHEKAKGFVASFFILFDSKIKLAIKKQLRSISKIGVHWNRFPTGFKLGKIHVVGKVKALHSQLKIIGAVRSCRSHGLLVGSDPTAFFRILDANKIHIDSSYGPNEGVGKGYLFGSCYPFFPMDRNGFLFNCLELPITIQENYGTATVDDIKILLKDSDAKYHQVFNLLLHPEHILLDASRYRTWQKIMALSFENSWKTNLIALNVWLRKRAASKLQSRGNKIICYDSGLTTFYKSKTGNVKQIGKKYKLIS